LKLGILSDTHDNVPQVRKAVALFNREMVDLVLHAGDYVAPFSVKPLFESTLGHIPRPLGRSMLLGIPRCLRRGSLFAM